MKKFKLLLMLFLLFIISGCTIDISKYIEEKKTDKEEEVTDLEEVKSVGVFSSIDTPLSIGEYGIASKYNAFLNEYRDIDVKLNNIYEDADSIVNNYNLSNPDKLVEKQSGFKYVVLDYEVVFVDFETESFGDKARLDIEIVDSKGNSFIVDDVKQVIEVYVLEEDLGVVLGGVGTVKIAFAIPDNVTSYFIKFGTYDHTVAYYKV